MNKRNASPGERARFIWYTVKLKGGDAYMCGTCANRYRQYDRERYEDEDWVGEQPACERCWKPLPPHSL